jgi:hypothetical protein
MSSKPDLDNDVSKVRLRVLLQGTAFVGGDVAAALNVSTPDRETLLSSHWERTVMQPLDFFLGNIPVRISPGARLGLDASYLGQLQGSFRLGLQARLRVTANLDFDSNRGLQTDFDVEPLSGQFWPPTWLLWSKNFGFSSVLRPELWVDASLGNLRNVHLELALKPQLNVSLLRQTPSYGPHTVKEHLRNRLAVYPFRILGLESGVAFAVKITANGQERVTSSQIGFGVIEYSDDGQKFDFGFIRESALMMGEIQVSLLRNGQEPPIATANIACDSHVDGECTPSPVEAVMEVDGQTVIIQLSVLWQPNPVTTLDRKLRGISMSLQDMRITESMVETVTAAMKLKYDKDHLTDMDLPAMVRNSMMFRFTRSSRKYDLPVVLTLTGNKSGSMSWILGSNTTFDLGQCYLDSWKAHLTQDFDIESEGADISKQQLRKLLVPTLELLIDGKLVGSANLPEVSWDLQGAITQPSFGTDVYDSGKAEHNFGTIPVGFPMHDVTSKELIGATGVNFDVVDIHLIPSWIHPAEDEDVSENSRYTLMWTTGSSPTEKERFILEAIKYDEHAAHQGFLKQDLELQCAPAPPEVAARNRHSFDNLCIFNTTIEVSKKLRQGIAFVVRWQKDGREHVMPSTLVNFLHSSGKLRRATAEEWSFGPLQVHSSNVDFQDAMKEFNPHCSQLPLHYVVEISASVRTKVHSPTSGPLSADYDSGCPGARRD